MSGSGDYNQSLEAITDAIDKHIEGRWRKDDGGDEAAGVAVPAG
jgi:hypothetical protein